MSLRFIFTSLLLVLACFAGAASAESFEKALMPGEVIQGHFKYELDCNKCHQSFDKAAQPRLCAECHKEIAADLSSKTRMHGRLEDKVCRNCHTEHKGRNARIAVLDKDRFDHGRTDFPLKGAHRDARLKCAGCHVAKARFRDAPRLCNDCHRKDDQENGHKGGLGKQCENCHDEKSWKDARFDHEKTKFPLAGGKHADAKCSGCHADKTYKNTPLDCNVCHKKDDQEKGHKGNYGAKCESCHNDKDWKELRFKHDTDTRYVLRGKHVQVKCNSCHVPEKGLLYKQKLPEKCIACHKKDEQEKGHRGGLGEKCESCHNERGWKNSNFNHDDTHFLLRDKHKEAKCDTCHKGGVSGPNARLKMEKACVACHRKDDQAKGHKGRYGNKCESCHNEKNWKGSLFDHDRDTKYKLKNKHKEARCDACHLPEKGALYQQHKLESRCIACHGKDDKHKNQLGNKCETCHNEKRWQDAPYDHNKSRFPLTGSHPGVECKKCHQTPAFHDAPSTCAACHEKDDKHNRLFGARCESCHYTGTWKSWDFDHGTTRFVLDGRHVKAACHDCHKESTRNQSKPGRACISCHLKDDLHNGGFSGQCERCHVTSDWKKVRK
ncbi:MAG: cytochrome c3 family protein [Sulfuricella sp.]